MKKKICLILFIVGFIVGVKLNDKGRLERI